MFTPKRHTLTQRRSVTPQLDRWKPNGNKVYLGPDLSRQILKGSVLYASLAECREVIHSQLISDFEQCEMSLLPPSDLPTMPDAVTGVGAVAMPDGRVLICGGAIVEVKQGGAVSWQ